MNLFMLSFLYIFLGCTVDDDDSACKDVICTMEYRTIAVSVKDQNHNPVSLDSFKVINLINGRDLTSNVNSTDLELMQQHGSYPLFADKYLASYQNQELEIQFNGYADNKKIVSRNFTVGADCCHVFLVSGDTSIVLE